ncbi:HutD/Ves family protein [Parasedimentitalea maritima]|nr:HutD family protein [Zongyanglinia marina]
MRLSINQSAAVQWKNGGGTTHELGQRVEAGELIWRLSLANIEKDGPFSIFPGLCRIHTIVAGQGLCLSGDGNTLLVKPFQPVSFDGGLKLEAQLADGPCRAFNVIFDPRRVQATAHLHTTGTMTVDVGEHALFVLAGEMDLGAAGCFSKFQGLVLNGPATGEISDGGVVLHICFAQT